MNDLNASGWTDDRLMQAYDLLYSILSETDKEHHAYPKLKKARDLVEDIDVEFERARA